MAQPTYIARKGEDADFAAITGSSLTVGGVVINMDDYRVPFTSGTKYWVDSVTGSDANAGTLMSAPKATIDAAIGLCTANVGDVILVFPGHAETLTAKITADIAGITIVGLGDGLTRPQITVNGTIDGIDVTAADVTIDGLYFNEATAAATSNINIAAARCTLRRVHMDCGANDVDVITVTAAGELPILENCTVLITANGPDSWVKFEGVVDRPIIRGNHIIGSDGTNAYDDGVLDFNSQAVTNPAVVNNIFNGAGAATTVVANGGSVTGAIYAHNVYGGSATDADNIAAITAVTLAADAIGASEIAAGAIAADAFAAGAIDAAAIAAGAIDAGAFAAGAITATVIATGAIDADAIAADTALGADNANNAFASTSVVADQDGSLLERSEQLMQLAAMAGFYNSANYLAVTADFTSVTWNTVAAHEIATVTGAVRMLILPESTATPTSAGSGGTLILGDETTTNSLITSSDAENLATGEWWLDATITHTVATRTAMNALEFCVAAGKDIGYTIGGEALTGGSIVFHIWWVGLDATGAVAAGAGGVL